MRNKIYLQEVKKSPATSKYKYDAYFRLVGKSGERFKKTSFGWKGYSDFTKHKDKDRRERYIKRHKKDLQTKDPTRAGYLSMFVLWNKPSLSGSIADYKRRLAKYNKTGRFPISI